MAAWFGLERYTWSQKRNGVEVDVRASWGAAVLRPYIIVLDGKNEVLLTSEILRFALDDRRGFAERRKKGRKRSVVEVDV